MKIAMLKRGGRVLTAAVVGLLLASCATQKEIASLRTLSPKTIAEARSVVVFTVNCDSLRVNVNGAVDWWSTTVGQGLIFFPIIGPIRYPQDADYEAKIRPLREPHLQAWHEYYMKMLAAAIHLPGATSTVFKVVTAAELKQGIFPNQVAADLYLDCTPRFRMGSSCWQWAEPDTILAAVTGPIVIERAAAERAGRELARIYEEPVDHNTLVTSQRWSLEPFPFEGCYREYTALTSPEYKKHLWLENRGQLLDQETRKLLERLAAEVQLNLTVRGGVFSTRHGDR
jgi:hypothetical protein